MSCLTSTGPTWCETVDRHAVNRWPSLREIRTTGVVAAACVRREIVATREAPRGGWEVTGQPESREGQAGPLGVADGSV